MVQRRDPAAQGYPYRREPDPASTDSNAGAPLRENPCGSRGDQIVPRYAPLPPLFSGFRDDQYRDPSVRRPSAVPETPVSVLSSRPKVTGGLSGALWISCRRCVGPASDDPGQPEESLG